jgi:NAD(P)-dependent dehydrogenase (short-subunit alcohol dehydrogenase family)
MEADMGGRVCGKVAIVTGAGSVGSGIGNGKAAALLYASEGAKVVLVDNRLDAARETKDLIDQRNGNCLVIEADVSQSGDCESVVESCIRAFKRIDILHNNVGIEIAGGIDEITEDSWDRVMAVNLKSMFLMCKCTLPHMVRQGSGSIVNVSSVNAIRTLPALSVPYSVSKAGIIALTREIAVQFASRGVRANTLLLGMMNTPMVAASLAAAYGGDVAEMTRIRDSMCPTGKQGEASDAAYAALFLASDEARYITGATIVVDGGLSCRV